MFRYDIILAKDVTQNVSGDKRSTCQAIMEAAELSEETWKIGKTKVFMKESDMVRNRKVLRGYHFSKALGGLRSKCRSLKQTKKPPCNVTPTRELSPSVALEHSVQCDHHKRAIPERRFGTLRAM